MASVQDLTPAEIESHYFNVNPPPPTLKEHCDAAEAFVAQHVKTGRRVALVTSGGTTVPLETQTVRFIDNFSAGTRGATSAEYFLQEGYAVIFLHRQFSLLPFSRHYSHSTNCFLDFMDEAGHDQGQDGGGPNNDGPIVVRPEYQTEMRKVLRRYRDAKQNNLLLLLPFTSVTEYLYSLRALATIMRPLKSKALFYLAAAVSDFFIPRDRMVEHKIQSNEQPLTNTDQPKSPEKKDPVTPENIYTGFNDPQPPTTGKKLIVDLDPVPKFLYRLVDGWAPQGSMIISFKLETDPDLLISKSEQALQRYSHDLVVGNLLSNRKWEVVFVSREKKSGGFALRWLRIPKPTTKSRRGSVVTGTTPAESQPQPEAEIESLIVPELKKMHSGMIEGAETPLAA